MPGMPARLLAGGERFKLQRAVQDIKHLPELLHGNLAGSGNLPNGAEGHCGAKRLAGSRLITPFALMDIVIIGLSA